MSRERTILIRYDEIALKGKNRRFFIERLRHNIRSGLRGLDGVRVEVPHGRVLLHCADSQTQEIVKRLKVVSGIASMSVGVMVEPDLEAMARQGVEWIAPLVEKNPNATFCVRTRRSHKGYELTSTEVDREVGGRILEQLRPQGLSVNIDRADFRLEIEIGLPHTVMFQNRIEGLRGLPVGTSGKVLGLLSGGIDSPVALFRMIRRGCRAHAIFFDNQPYMGKGGHDKVQRLCRVLTRYQQAMRLWVVPFEEVQVAIRDNCRPDNRVVLYRRMMYRIAQALAEREGYQALVTGESLGQVASQTLENLNAVSRVVQCSVFRPLIGMDKNEIITQAKNIGTFDISIEPQPDCCSVFMPEHPVTKARLPELENDETRYPWEELLRQALEKTEVQDPEPSPF